VTAALVALTGLATLTGAGPPAAGATRQPVQRSSQICPALSGPNSASTTYTSFTPSGTATGASGSAQLLPAAAGSSAGSGTAYTKPVAPLSAPGKPVTATSGNSGAPALIGTADGRLAPGWSVQETTVINTGPQRGLLGTSCTTPGTGFWFPGTSTSPNRMDYAQLTNPDATSAVVNLALYGTSGSVKTAAGNGITVPPRSSVSVLLSTLTATQAQDLTLHVTASTGRVAAAVEALDANAGSDWLNAAAGPATSLVMPGIPADATDVRLVVFATGSTDANLNVRLLTPNGVITPAGHETVYVKSGMTSAVDFGALTQGEAGSLILSPSNPKNASPVVAALRITRGKGASQEMAFLPAVTPVGQRATVADNGPTGSTLSLAVPSGTATVKVTTSASTSGGTPVTRTVTVKGGTTVAMKSPLSSSAKGTYAVTVETVSGGPVYASRTLALPQGGISMFTIQTLSDDHGTVEVPAAREDLSILN
jgi:hypothetical protein